MTATDATIDARALAGGVRLHERTVHGEPERTR